MVIQIQTDASTTSGICKEYLYFISLLSNMDTSIDTNYKFGVFLILNVQELIFIILKNLMNISFFL